MQNLITQQGNDTFSRKLHIIYRNFYTFQVVNVLYRENDWVYVIAADTRMEGFVPHSYCAPYTSQLAEMTLASLNSVKKKLPRSSETDCDPLSAGRLQEVQQTDTGSASDCESYARNNITTAEVSVNRSNITQSQNSIQTISSQPDIHPFFKVPRSVAVACTKFECLSPRRS